MIDLTHSSIYGNNSVILKAEMTFSNRFLQDLEIILVVIILVMAVYAVHQKYRQLSSFGQLDPTIFNRYPLSGFVLIFILPFSILGFFQLNKTKVAGWPKRCQPRVIHSSISILFRILVIHFSAKLEGVVKVQGHNSPQVSNNFTCH